MKSLDTEPDRYRHLDVAQLIKHAFGVARAFKGHRATLLYLYWEPLNANDIPELCEHRAEVERFASEVSSGFPEFVTATYPQLWGNWRGSRYGWLRTHAAHLERRYGIAI